MGIRFVNNWATALILAQDWCSPSSLRCVLYQLNSWINSIHLPKSV